MINDIFCALALSQVRHKPNTHFLEPQINNRFLIDAHYSALVCACQQLLGAPSVPGTGVSRVLECGNSGQNNISEYLPNYISGLAPGPGLSWLLTSPASVTTRKVKINKICSGIKIISMDNDVLKGSFHAS